jgi:hypothetical protein
MGMGRDGRPGSGSSSAPSLNACGSVVKFPAWMRQYEPKSYSRVVSGLRDVRNEIRLGPHTACCT